MGILPALSPFASIFDLCNTGFALWVMPDGNCPSPLTQSEDDEVLCAVSCGVYQGWVMLSIHDNDACRSMAVDVRRTKAPQKTFSCVQSHEALQCTERPLRNHTFSARSHALCVSVCVYGL